MTRLTFSDRLPFEIGIAGLAQTLAQDLNSVAEVHETWLGRYITTTADKEAVREAARLYLDPIGVAWSVT